MPEEQKQEDSFKFISSYIHYTYNKKSGKSIPVLLLVYKNERTHVKKYEVINDPDFTYYLTSLEAADKYPYPIDCIPFEDVEEYTTNYSNLFDDIRDKMDTEFIYEYDRIKFSDSNSKRSELKQLVHLNKDVHGSDINLEDFYISKHYDKYKFENMDASCKLAKGYFDIENDISTFRGFPSADQAPCPINLVSYFNDENMTMYTFMLKEEDNASQEEFLKKENLIEFKKYLKEKYKNRGYDNVKFIFKLFENEFDLIVAFFDTLNSLSPDIVGGWNTMGYDLKYFINRLAVLLNMDCTNLDREDKAEIAKYICDKDLEFSSFEYSEDTKNQDPAENGTTFRGTFLFNFIDQMCLYASLRKSSKKESYTLDAICEEELGENKTDLDPDNEGITIQNINIKDYRRFVEYNIHDTMLLFMLEEELGDMDTLYYVSGITRTRITKCLKKTICLKNTYSSFCKENGYIMSNNHNGNYLNPMGDKAETFRGAFVGDPELMSNTGKLMFNKMSKYIFDSVIDMDYAALYPHVILAFNVDNTTQLYRILLSDEEGNDIAPEFMDDIITRDYLSIGTKYFGLPNILELNAGLTEYINNGLKEVND